MLDKRHPLPMYYQLKELIREKIAAGEWQPGDLIPSERELSERYSISRMTVRQALTELANDGLLHRDQGRGTFVARPKIRERLSRLTSFTEDMRARGKQASAQVLRLEMVPAGAKVADALQIEFAQPVALIKRLRLADAEPVGIECCHLSFEGCETVLQEDLSGSLYELLGKRFGLVPIWAQEELEAGVCGPREAQTLGMQRGEPVLLIRRWTFDQDQRPIEYVESVYRGDKYVLSVELIAEEHPAL